jgi:hypothetical protein
MRPVYLHEAMIAGTYYEEVAVVVEHYAMACEEHEWHLYLFYTTFKN